MTIGNQLKKARQKKQVSLEDVYKKTKIHPNILTALEEDSYSHILNPTYIRSFLKEYALYLEMDAEKILQEYDTAHIKEKTRPQPQAVSPAETKPLFSGFDKEKVVEFGRRVAVYIFVFVIIIVLTKATVFVVKKIQRTISLHRQATLQRAASAKKPSPVKKTALPTVRPQKRPEPKKQEKPVKQPILSPEKVAIPHGEKLILTVTATDDSVWLQVKVDGKIFSHGLLKKGTSEKWTASDNFTIWTNKADALQLNLNGKDMGTAGRGVKKDIIITRDGIKKQP